MRVLLRVLAPLLGLGLAAIGVLVAVEVIAAWMRPVTGQGLVVPWVAWRATLEATTWQDDPVAAVAIGVGVVGLLLVLVGLFARRHDVLLAVPSPDLTVATSPQVLARLVGRHVRTADDVASASVTASARRISVRAEGWSTDSAGPGGTDGTEGSDLRRTVTHRVDELLDELPLARRPRVSVTTSVRKGPR
ncbi:DUF6286 domain-containing protein [Pseudonocardia bannensis]|uniref:DUF6286 domain-containing protein n=1 Tax=Pseudonocardia bannensis TaxID=630973 RepID=A0A848DPG1_9PSEU|nr:DUF6286 domain-containing protein [Pseudonocardia bannensis]NMH94730.1 hypothetical protein [Pseudonocardia bannensis]